MRNQIVVLVMFLLYTVHSQTTEKCVCVPSYQCRTNGTVCTDGDGLIDERYPILTVRRTTADLKSLPKTCPSINETSGTPKNLGVSCQNCTCSGPEVCCKLPTHDAVTPLKPADNVTPRKPNNSTSCGYINPEGINHEMSVQGNEALFGEFPWMVQILENGKYRCGGSLINPSIILTAAHCFKYSHKKKYKVRAGEWDFSSTKEIMKHQDRDVVTVVAHDGDSYTSGTYYNDIALVFLDQPLELKPHINLTCLIPASGIPTNTRCYTLGWGTSRYTRVQSGSTILKKIDLSLVGKPDCEKALRTTRLGRYYNLHESFICAAGEKHGDTYIGDVGGPLFCPIEGQENRYQQVGIAAWSTDCIGVYVDVAVLRTWIDEEIADRHLDTSEYQYSQFGDRHYWF